MAQVLVLEFDMTEAFDTYQSINRLIGLDTETGEGDWPAGLISHVGGLGGDSNLIVVETWESRADQEAFMQSRLGPALKKLDVAPPMRQQWFSRAGEIHRY